MTRAVIKAHRWIGLLSAALICIAALTAIAINHRAAWKSPAPPGGPYGQYLLSVGVDPLDGRRIWLGTGEGLFRSSDAGASWELAMPGQQVVAVAFVPTEPRRMRVALRSHGIVETTDGRTFTPVDLPFRAGEGAEVVGMAYTPRGSFTVATTAGLYTKAPEEGWSFVPRPATPQAAPDAGRRLLRVIYDLHDGRFWGPWGVLVTDGASAGMIVLVLTGLYMFFRWK